MFTKITITVFKTLLQMFLLFNFLLLLRNLISAKVLIIFITLISPSFITSNVEEIQSSKKRLKLVQYFEDKKGQLEYYFKKLTLTVKLDKNGKMLFL